MFMEICFVFIREILLIPLVISKKPVIIGLIKEVSICKMLKRGIKSKEKFIVLITIVPSIFYYFIAVRMTSFQELRYIMPVIPFVILTFFFILNEFITFKYNYILFRIVYR